MLIRYECSDFLIAFKPHNLPTVPLKNQQEKTLLSLVAEKYPEVMQVCGKNNWEGSALHRLDTATEGLVIFARNQAFYNYLQKIQNEDKLIKTYKAVCNGKPEKEIHKIQTYFRSFGPRGSMVKPETDKEKSDNGRLYTTNIENSISDGSFTVFECKITRGFRHQIRAHLSYIGCPIVGDKLYGNTEEKGDLLLTCTGVSFPENDDTVFNFNENGC